MTTRRWVDWVNVLLGVWMIASPWLFTVASGDRPADWNSWSVGGGVLALAFFAMYKPSVWGGAAAVMLGAWLTISPWVLELARPSTSARNAVISGLLVIGYALWAIRIDVTSGDGSAYHTYQRRPA
jgi:hypothetical protein